MLLNIAFSFLTFATASHLDAEAETQRQAVIQAFNNEALNDRQRGADALRIFNKEGDEKRLDRLANQTKEEREKWCKSLWQRQQYYMRDKKSGYQVDLPQDSHAQFVKKLDDEAREVRSKWEDKFNSHPRLAQNPENLFEVRRAAYAQAVLDLKRIEAGGAQTAKGTSPCEMMIKSEQETLKASPDSMAGEWQNQAYARWYIRYLTNDTGWLTPEERTESSAGPPKKVKGKS
ncbi:MAG: hypothetical protein C5B47_03170 [Verrucomicrobia bacterium]|nr:MAG: hypothetical protein C5B47_03170 [Verrucomicrobiota bacterium]